MWWQKTYINRRDWILENMGALDLSSNQILVLLMIDFMNQNQLEITLEALAKRLGWELSQVDSVIHDLVRQQILSIRVSKDVLDFNLEGLFEERIAYEFASGDLFQVFESEFGRLLSQNELMMMNSWLQTYSQDEILDALRNAMIYKKLSMHYINAILANKARERQGQFHEN